MGSTALRFTVVCAFLVVLLGAGCRGGGELADADWPMYRGDMAGTGYSPLVQITPGNVGTLARAWSYSIEAAADADGQTLARAPNSQATPIVLGDRMYVPAADGVVALDPTTGQEVWRRRISGDPPSRRGVAYWPGDGETPPRILFTSGSRLLAVDAEEGTPVPAFGVGGVVDLGIPYNSVPFVYDDIVVVGANTPPGTGGGVGNARAFSALTGEKLWEFSSVPQPGSVGNDTWEGDSWQGRLGVNAWPFYFTMDEARELLYLPLASPIPGAYGGDRGGANLFGNSVVAVRIRTGEYVWHFQTIHHDLWDADPPAPPVLFDIPRGASSVPALGVTTKSGYLYILNRESGEPIYGVEERPVPASDVPGERSYPTQPFPVKPPPLARVSYGLGDLVTADDTSPEHGAACAALVASVGEIYNAGPFTPWVYRPEGGPERTTLLFPGSVGGPNWGGVAFDPGSGYLFLFSQDIGWLGWMERAEDGSPGDVVWQRPLGITEGLPPDRRKTGRPGRAAAIVSGSGLLFIAATDDSRFRAIEVATGRELWVTTFERRGNANPITYQGRDGRQYVAVVATDRVVAFALP